MDIRPVFINSTLARPLWILHEYFHKPQAEEQPVEYEITIITHTQLHRYWCVNSFFKGAPPDMRNSSMACAKFHDKAVKLIISLLRWLAPYPKGGRKVLNSGQEIDRYTHKLLWAIIAGEFNSTARDQSKTFSKYLTRWCTLQQVQFGNFWFIPYDTMPQYASALCQINAYQEWVGVCGLC